METERSMTEVMMFICSTKCCNIISDVIHKIILDIETVCMYIYIPYIFSKIGLSSVFFCVSVFKARKKKSLKFNDQQELLLSLPVVLWPSMS